MNADRIAEVYEGSHGTPRSQELARERVHWMCRQVAGDEVLDIGCSQGIVSLLLGREGRSVVGIDRETAVMAEAERRLALEEPTVRARVTFLEAEARAVPFEDARFDTVLLGEVLEHLIDPAVVLDEARRLLRSGGRIVVTTPYGLFPYHDHKDPLYLTELLALLTKRFGKLELKLLHHYLLIVGEPSARGSGANTGLLADALSIAEQRLRVQDREVSIQRATAKRLPADLEAARAKAREQDAMAELTAERDAAVAAAERLKAAEADLERREAQLAELVRERSERALRLEVERDHLVERASAAEARVEQLAGRVDAAAAAAEQAARRIATLDGERDTFQQRAAELGATLGRVQQQLETATAAATEAQQRAARLELELERRDDEQTAREQAQAEVARIAAELDDARVQQQKQTRRLDEATVAVDAQEASASAVNEELEAARLERDEAVATLEAALREREEADDQRYRVQAELDIARADAQRLQQELRTAEGGPGPAVTDEAASMRAEGVERELAELRTRLQTSAELQQRVVELEAELVAASANGGATPDQSQLREELAAAQQVIAAATAELDRRVDESGEQGVELDAARTEIARLTAELKVAEVVATRRTV